MLRTLPLLTVLLATCSNIASPDPVVHDAGAGPNPLSDTTQLAQYVVGAFEDSKGGLWFGTIDNGVAHVHDGTISFIDSTHGLPPNGGHGIAESRDGMIWIAGHDGVYIYDPSKPGAVQVLHTTEAKVDTDRSGNVWVSTQGKVFRYTDARSREEFVVPVPKELPTVYSIDPRKLVFHLEDSQGNLWFSTDGHGAFRYDPSTALRPGGQGFTHFTKADGLCSNTPWNIAEDAEGRIWFACIQAYQPKMTGDGGLCVLDPSAPLRVGTSAFTTFPDVVGLHHNDLYTLYKDREGNLYSSAVGIGMYRIKGDDFTLFNTTDRPDLNAGFGLQAMMQDRNGTLWCGFSGGLFRFNGEGFVNVTRGGPWE